MDRLDGYFTNLCPNCSKKVSFERASLGLPCENCYKKGEVCSIDLKELKYFCNFIEHVRDFELFFKKTTKNEPYPLQKTWFKKYLLNKSFSIIAPTGVGKTTFGLVLARYLNGKKLFVLPTKLLVEEYERRAKQMGLEILTIHHKLGKKERYIREELIRNKKFEVLAITTSYLAKNFDKIRDFYELVFVDDVDSILKYSRVIDKLLYLIGIKKFEIDLAERYIEKRNKELLEKLEKIRKKRILGSLLVSSATTRPRLKRAQLLYYLLGFSIGKNNTSMVSLHELYHSLDDKKLVKTIKKLGGGIFLFFSLKHKDKAKRIEEILNKNGIKAINYKEVGETELDKFKRGEIKVLIGLSHSHNPLVRGIDIPQSAKYAIFYGVPVIKLEDGYIADITSYIQGSGRVSRMYFNGVTKGISIVFVDDENLFSQLKKRINAYREENFNPLDMEDLEKLKKVIDEERKRLENKEQRESLNKIESILVVVESPNKIRTISSFFSDFPIRRILNNVLIYEFSIGNKNISLTASIGHLTDLITKKFDYGIDMDRVIPYYTTLKKCKDKQFTDEVECPTKNLKDKKELIDTLRKLSLENDRILIATDPDTEGEKIAYDLYLSLKLYNKNIERASFNAITRNDFLSALSKTDKIDENKVKSQVMRRILDRIVGFRLSEIAKKEFNDFNISIGRVQTPVLGFIINQYKKSLKKYNFLVFELFGKKFKIKDNSTQKKTTKKLKVFVKIKDKREEEKIVPPFNTEMLIREVNKKFGLSSKEIMRIAQNLFERGLITYHRTDSVRVSEEGLRIASKYIKENIGENFLFLKKFSSSKGAHECIRPTKPIDDLSIFEEQGKRFEENEKKIYDMVFKRFILSQMKPLRVVKTKFSLLLENKSSYGEYELEEITKVFDRELNKYYNINEVCVKQGSYEVDFKLVRESEEKPMRESDVVREMKEHGIGRPSTYSVIINKLYERGYVLNRGGYLIPTKKGMELYRFAIERFEEFSSLGFTKEMELWIEDVEKTGEFKEKLKEVWKKLKTLRV